MVAFAFPWAFLILFGWFLLPRDPGWVWRFVASVLLVTALAQPSLVQPGQQLAVVVDVSESVGTRGLEAARELELPSGANPMNIIFAAEARRIDDFAQVTDADISAIRSAETNLAGALGYARAQGATRILLVASGMESRGRAVAALPDVPVDVKKVDPVPNARVVRLITPDTVAPGDTFDAVVVVETDRDTALTLRPSAGEDDFSPIRTRIEAGRHTFSFSVTAPTEGDFDVAVNLDVGFEQPTADDSQRVTVAVDKPGRILVVDDPALAAVLEAQDLDVVQGTPDDLVAPQDYAAVVVRGDADGFTSGQKAQLASYVERGGGLLMTGGEGSFGLSGWYRTPVADVLPVELELPTEVEVPRVAIVMVIDRSGSMRAESPSRMSLAQRGAVDLVEQAHPDDLLGLIAFDHGYEWIFELRQATDRGKLEMREKILNLAPGGGTIVSPAYERAIDALRDTDAAIKHIILLSDGEFFDGTGLQGPASMGPRPDFEVMAAEALDDGITTTTIGIGEADFATVEKMARAGGGRFYGVTDTRDLPQVFTTETIIAGRTLVRDEPLTPTLHRHPLTLALSEPPQIEAYIASALKEGSEMLLEGLGGEPVLAIKRHGLGRTAALTTDLNAWAGEMTAWPDLPALTSTVLRWLAASPDPYSVTLTPEGNRLRVVVNAVKDGEYLADERLFARYHGTEARLEQTGPGRYEALLDTPPQGGNVVISKRGDIVARSPVGFPPAALDPEGAGDRLREIAQLSGGSEIVATELYDPALGRARVSAWPWFAIAGMTVFLLELWSRRFGFRQEAPAAVSASR